MNDFDREIVDDVEAHSRAPLQTDRLVNYQRWTIWLVMALLGLIILAALPVAAQEATQPITFDMINKIARELYCPVCPNETLEACQTQACAQWRAEIANQIGLGQTEQQIIDSFVRRYGDRVLGTPQDPALRALSLVTPFVIAGLALLVGIFTFMRWRRRTPLTPASASGTAPAISDDYRKQLERDLRE
ncbi:MAG: cytochrome c-type biogenesis protein CcmH [Chloroflexota bacterium]